MMEYTALLGKVIAEELDIDGAEAAALLETPPDPKLGDYAFPCFQLARTLRKAPQQIASDLAGKLTPPEFIQRVEAAGPYVNFYLDRVRFAKDVVGAVQKQPDRYGASEMGKGRTVVMDLSLIHICCARVERPPHPDCWWVHRAGSDQALP